MSVPARLSIVTLGVSDLTSAVAFYERLGWERRSSSNDEIAWFGLSGVYVGLFPRHELAADANLADERSRGFEGFTLAINVHTEAQVDDALRSAEAAGATIVKPATRADWGGLSGYFTDPDGHAWEVAYNPFFPLDAEGRITIP